MDGSRASISGAIPISGSKTSALNVPSARAIKNYALFRQRLRSREDLDSGLAPDS